VAGVFDSAKFFNGPKTVSSNIRRRRLALIFPVHRAETLAPKQKPHAIFLRQLHPSVTERRVHPMPAARSISFRQANRIKNLGGIIVQGLRQHGSLEITQAPATI